MYFETGGGGVGLNQYGEEPRVLDESLHAGSAMSTARE